MRLTCSAAQAVDVWRSLEDAYWEDGEAQIYAYRLMPYRPAYNLGDTTRQEDLQQQLDANRDLLSLCREFAERRDCDILIGTTPLATFAEDYPLAHYADVTVTRRSGRSGGET